MTKCTCLRCGYTWEPRTNDRPKSCPQCHSYQWDKPRKRENTNNKQEGTKMITKTDMEKREVKEKQTMEKRMIHGSTWKLIGWGIIGKPQDGLLVDGPGGKSLDLHGYNESDYWDRHGKFLGPDIYGIVPIYSDDMGNRYPNGAIQYPYLA